MPRCLRRGRSQKSETQSTPFHADCLLLPPPRVVAWSKWLCSVHILCAAQDKVSLLILFISLFPYLQCHCCRHGAPDCLMSFVRKHHPSKTFARSVSAETTAAICCEGRQEWLCQGCSVQKQAGSQLVVRVAREGLYSRDNSYALRGFKHQGYLQMPRLSHVQ